MSFLNRPISSKALGLFRVLFGILILYQFYKFKLRIDSFKDPDYLFFPFPELDWIPAVSAEAMLIIWAIGLITSFLVILGIGFRISSILLALVYGYFFSLDALYYNNHYYLIFLICLLLAFTNADRSFSLSLFKKKSKTQLVPFWQYGIFQLQLAIVFFYGGLSKVSYDWFSGNVLGDITSSAFVNNVLIYGGCLFDLIIPFALIFKRTRWFAILLIVFFNLSNHFLFDDIGSFPFLVIAALVLFMAEGHMPNFISKFFGNNNKEDAESFKMNKLIKISLIAFFAFQFLYPFRHHFIPGHVDWTGQGHYFAWRMKSFSKDSKLTVYGFDKTKKARTFKINHGLDNYRIQRLTAMPHMMPRFAENMRKLVEEQDGINPNFGISIDLLVSFNGQEAKRAISPNVDVSREVFNKYGENPWILKLE